MTIEGLNGLVKDPAHEALAAPARRRVRGIAALLLFAALLLIAANIPKIRAWRSVTARDRQASPARHGDAAPACATTSQTADGPQHREPPRPSSPAGPTAELAELMLEGTALRHVLIIWILASLARAVLTAARPRNPIAFPARSAWHGHAS